MMNDPEFSITEHKDTDEKQFDAWDNHDSIEVWKEEDGRLYIVVDERSHSRSAFQLTENQTKGLVEFLEKGYAEDKG
jgi:hypothetical protein